MPRSWEGCGNDRYLLDTGSAGDYINGRRGVYERARAVALDGHRIGIAMPVLAELWCGVEKSSTREHNEQKLRRVLPEFIVWPLTDAAAREYGRIAAMLQRTGRSIGKVDMLIAVIALSLGKTTVVSADSDMAVVPGLNVENWSVA